MRHSRRPWSPSESVAKLQTEPMHCLCNPLFRNWTPLTHFLTPCQNKLPSAICWQAERCLQTVLLYFQLRMGNRDGTFISMQPRGELRGKVFHPGRCTALPYRHFGIYCQWLRPSKIICIRLTCAVAYKPTDKVQKTFPQGHMIPVSCPFLWSNWHLPESWETAY